MDRQPAASLAAVPPPPHTHKTRRVLRFLGILTLESFTAAALGLTVGSFAPSPEAAIAIGPAVMLVWIVFGGWVSRRRSCVLGQWVAPHPWSPGLGVVCMHAGT